MKKFICALCSLAIIIICISGCNQSSENPFTADDAIKGQVGDLYYVVPNNAIADEKNDNGIVYSVPIENSTENYQLGIACMYVSESEASEEEVKIGFETMINDLLASLSKSESDDFPLESEPITDFLGITVDIGVKYTAESNGYKTTGIFAVTSRKLYLINYGVKTGFYDQSVWDSFYAQLKLV